jgi:hypothetical protein
MMHRSRQSEAANDAAWSRLYAAAVNQLLMAPQAFQLLYPATAWDWPETEPAVASAALYDFCTAAPAWSATGSFASSAGRYDHAYQEFLNALALRSSDPSTQHKIDAAQAVVRQAQDVYDRVFAAVAAAYAAQVADNEPTFTAWLASPAAGAYAAILDFIQNLMQDAQAALVPLAQAASTPNVGAAQAAMSDPANFMTITVPSGADVAPVPQWDVAMTPKAWVQQVRGGSGTSATLLLANADPPYDYAVTWAQQAASVPVPFWAVRSGGAWHRVAPFYDDAALTATIGIAAIETIAVMPGQWNSGTNVFRGGPFVAGYTAQRQPGSAAWMFGAGGIVAAFKTGLVACYQPSVVVTVGASTHAAFQKRWPDADGFALGPFAFGGGDDAASLQWSKHGAGYALSVTSTSQVPCILGVTVAAQPQ